MGKLTLRDESSKPKPKTRLTLRGGARVSPTVRVGHWAVFKHDGQTLTGRVTATWGSGYSIVSGAGDRAQTYLVTRNSIISSIPLEGHKLTLR